MYLAVHNLWQTLSLLLCAQRQFLLGMNKIGLPVTNLPSSWCIYTNRERSAWACRGIELRRTHEILFAVSLFKAAAVNSIICTYILLFIFQCLTCARMVVA